MQISNSYQQNFKSTFPVAHWVAETNGSYAPVSNMALVKKLQGKLIRILNKPLAQNNKPLNNVEQKIRAYMGSSDVDYRKIPRVRSFYDRTENYPKSFRPISYIISGKDVSNFEKLYCKNIGRAKGQEQESLNCLYPQEAYDAINLYKTKGLKYVKDNKKQIKDKNNIPQILHTKFEIVRNKLGKIIDYKLLDVRFLPSKGEGNPLEKLK